MQKLCELEPSVDYDADFVSSDFQHSTNSTEQYVIKHDLDTVLAQQSVIENDQNNQHPIDESALYLAAYLAYLCDDLRVM